MTGVTGISADVRAALGTDLSNELQRLKPLEGKWQSRAVQALQNEVNRFINIFRTGKFSTEAQVCTRLEKEVKKLQRRMDEITFNADKGDMHQVKYDIRMLESIADLTNKMTGFLDKFAERKGKTTKSYMKFRGSLNELRTLNQQSLERSKRILESVTPRLATFLETPKAKEIKRSVTPLIKAQAGRVVVPRHLQIARTLQDTIKHAQSVGKNRAGYAESLSANTLAEFRNILESEPEKLAAKEEKLLKRAKAASHEIRGAFIRSGGVPSEISSTLRSLEAEIEKLEKPQGAPQATLAEALPKLVQTAYKQHGLRDRLSETQNSELVELLFVNIKPPANSPEEAARVGKKTIELIAFAFQSENIPAELQERLSDLDELISKLPIVKKEVREERPSERVVRDLPGLIAEAFEQYGIAGVLKTEEKTFLENLSNPEAVQKMPIKKLQENVGRAIPLLQRAVMGAYGDIPPELMKKMEGIEKQAKRMQKFQGRVEEARVKLTEAERKRAIAEAKRVKTEGQKALIKAIALGREHGGYSVFGGPDNSTNRFLDELRDQDPTSFSSKTADRALRILFGGFGWDIEKIPPHIMPSMVALNASVRKMREIESPMWLKQFRTSKF